MKNEIKPKICISICEKTKEEIINKAYSLSKLDIDLIEWRVDYFQDIYNIIDLKEILLKIKNIIKDKKLIFTVRSFEEGGNFKLEEEYYKSLNYEIIKLSIVDFIDIEFSNPKAYIEEIKVLAIKNSVNLIISKHIYSTFSKKDLISMFCKAQDLGADFIKFVIMPNNLKDVIDFILITKEIYDNYAKVPMIFIAMSDIGILTRLIGGFLGSCITFASYEAKSSALGQIDIAYVKDILEILYKKDRG